TLGYIGGEVIAPWLHSLDQHIKHGIWLVLVIGIVAGVRWWMKRRSTRKAQ
ncbi:DedA family protein, partial [Citrobacter freundii]